MLYFKRLLLVALAIIIVSVSAPGFAKTTEQAKPLFLVFGGPVGDKPGECDARIVSSVIHQLSDTGKVQVISFNPDLPKIARAVLEKRLSGEILSQPSEPKAAIAIGQAAGASHVLRIRGGVQPNTEKKGDKEVTNGTKVVVTLELADLKNNKRWTHSSESPVSNQVGLKESLKIDNAVYTASSEAVTQIILLAFGQATLLDIQDAQQAAQSAEPAPQPGTEDATEETPLAPPEPRNLDGDYNSSLGNADSYIAQHDMPNAVIELRKAINLKPAEIAPRVKLAGIYEGLGMVQQAIDECKRALLFNNNDLSVHTLLAKLYMEKGALNEAMEQNKEIVRLSPQSVDARLNFGDMLWNQSKLDDAVAAYKDASSIAPDNPTPHDKLAKLYQARRMYAPALDEAFTARLLTAGMKPSDPKAYSIEAKLIQDEFNLIVGKLTEARSDFKSSRMVRDDYYQERRDSAEHIDALDGFISKQAVPNTFKTAHAHAALAVSLLAQSNGYEVSSLETEKSYYSDQAAQLQTEAQKELGLYVKGLGKS